MTSIKEVLVHVPHSSIKMPGEDTGSFVRNEEETKAIAFEIADIYADRLFDIGADMLVFPVSRLIVDAERFLDDEKEIMAGRGLGAVYRNYYDGKPLRGEISADEREGLIRKYYLPHHETLYKTVREKADQFGRCLIIDGHSFSDRPLRLDLDQNTDRPDICIGTDKTHTPEPLREKVMDGFMSRGYTVKENTPYSGTIVPLEMYGDNRISSIMIEINKRLYMDGTKPREDVIEKLNREIREIIISE